MRLFFPDGVWLGYGRRSLSTGVDGLFATVPSAPGSDVGEPLFFLFWSGTSWVLTSKQGNSYNAKLVGLEDQFEMIEFVGGPLDGPNPSHPTFNSWLQVPEHPEGRYVYFQGKYYWELV
jgi:hypothetical protein